MSSTVLRPPASQDISSGRTIRWLGANNPTPGLRKTRPKPIICSIYRAQEVYPLSPLLGGGFPKEGGDACSTTNSFGIGGGCGTSGGVSKINKMSIERRCRLRSGRASSPSGANNPFARGEQSVGSGRTIRPQDCGKRAQNQSYIQFIGRKRRHDSQPSPRGRFSKGGGRCVWDNTLIFTVLRVKVAVGVSKGPYESHMRTRILVG